MLQVDEFIKNAKSPIKIYTDGACSGNPGDGGWGVYMFDGSGKECELSGAERNTTNNRMEMMAAIAALQKIPPQTLAHIYTDSQYLKNGITTWIKQWKVNNWYTSDRKPVKNQDLWVMLDALNQNLKIEWHWVVGHSGNFGNERVDAIARNAIVKLRLSR